ncbi:hypothetical protein [Saltatorellus ferox]
MTRPSAVTITQPITIQSSPELPAGSPTSGTTSSSSHTVSKV